MDDTTTLDYLEYVFSISRQQHQRSSNPFFMTENEARERAFAMPPTSPAYPRGPYRFVNREYFIITYRMDPMRCGP